MPQLTVVKDNPRKVSVVVSEAVKDAKQHPRQELPLHLCVHRFACCCCLSPTLTRNYYTPSMMFLVTGCLITSESVEVRKNLPGKYLEVFFSTPFTAH
ncbi:CLUMA_CG011626, isoform A [Clunio marinus]|uniref:CLUMA_CG011626, isoform A n=1 Tax=Clunio marinus TaxID=568069 RepID=A0A1J1IDH3_9DIPT|nr:CLUMA_CG011626, isoform A [Clunio marinus]